jgi:hypothetical protein
MCTEQHLDDVNILLCVLLCYRIFVNFTEVEHAVIIRHQPRGCLTDMGDFLGIFKLNPFVDILSMDHKDLQALIEIKLRLL